MARLNPSVVPMVLQHGASLVQQAMGAMRPSATASRAITSSDQLRSTRSVPTRTRERKWVVQSTQAGYAIMQIKHLQLEAKHGVKIRIPPMSTDTVKPVRQEFVIVGNDAMAMQACYEELDRVVGRTKGTLSPATTFRSDVVVWIFWLTCLLGICRLYK